MIKVTIKKATVWKSKRYAVGDCLEVEESTARRWIIHGIASTTDIAALTSDEPEEINDNLDMGGLSFKELRSLAKEMDVKVPIGANKVGLLTIIRNAERRRSGGE